jgi:xanthine dehydrogenase YagR molybdenum-binding subunit
MTVVGQPIDRVDGIQKITGAAIYSGDVRLPGLAYGVLVLSTVARGRIKSADVGSVSRLPGVLLVMTHGNAPRLPQGGRAAVNPPAGRVLSLLQDNEVHYNRQPVAVVVAETLPQAAAAAAQFKIQYENEPPELEFEHAKASAHSPGKVNGENADSSRGSLSGSGDDARVRETYTTPMQHHNPMEPHATVAHWQGERLTLYDSTQFISGSQSTIAKIFGIPKDNVRVICPFVGGGFGCKGSSWSHVALTAMAARQLGKPVKLVLERPNMFGPVGGRPQTEQNLSIAADSAGQFDAIRHDVFSHTSVIEDFAEPAALQTRILYACPNLSTSHRLVPLNVATPTFQRAPGHATGTFALESAIDELAYQLRIDPIELRLRNEPVSDPEKKVPWSSRSLRECYASGAAAFGWSGRQPAPGSLRDGHTMIGWGVASATYPANRQGASARARMTAEGRIIVQSGTHDLGTGTYTVMTQIAADALGFPMDRVTFELGDSLLPEAPVSGGSQSLASVGPAVQAAALALREKLVAMAIGDQASPVFGVSPEQVVIENGSVGRRTGSPREPVSAIWLRAGGQDIAADATAKPGAEKTQFSMHSFGAVFAEVRVDRDLGTIRVPRVVARYDVGRIINAKTGRSQLMGGIVWGIGMALMEESLLDPRSGRIVNANLAEYHVPTNADIGVIDVEAIGTADPQINSLGARGIGEIGITGVAAALANAVYHATGVRVRELPMTLDKILAKQDRSASA